MSDNSRNSRVTLAVLQVEIRHLRKDVETQTSELKSDIRSSRDGLRADIQLWREDIKETLKNHETRLRHVERTSTRQWITDAAILLVSTVLGVLGIRTPKP